MARVFITGSADGRVPDENRVGLGKCDERSHRRRAGSNDMLAVVAW
jgi:hypothetical protein